MVNGESVELTASQRQTYDNAYSNALGSALDALIASDAYADADDAGREKLVEKLYAYAAQSAKQEAAGAEPDKWVITGQEAVRDGVRLEDYFAVKTLASKQIEMVELIDGMDLSPTQKGKLLYYTVGTDAKQSLMDEEVDAGESVEKFASEAGAGARLWSK